MNALTLLEHAVEIAREAGALLRDFDRDRLEVRHKGAVDLVTRADGASEERILAAIRERFPDHAILAEESGETGGEAEYLWVVDPLDGTTNFAHGLPLWSVSIGVLRRGEPWVGVVYDPTRDECFSAARGYGARRNGEEIRVSTASELGKSLLVTGFPYDVHTGDVVNLDHFANFIRRARAVRRLGSAALDLAYVACGRFDGFWELKLHAWDVAAGALLVEEAGGRVTRFDGAAFDPFSDEILAGPEALLTPMMEVLAQGSRPGRPA